MSNEVQIDEYIDSQTTEKLTKLFQFANQEKSEELISRISEIANKKLLSHPHSKGYTLLHVCCLKKLHTVVKALLDLSIDANQSRKECGKTALHLACLSGDLISCHYLYQSGADLERCDKSGNTPLMYASQQGNVGIIYYLLQNNASVNSRNNQQSTALHIASYFGNHESVRLLINLGANIDVQNNLGMSPIHQAIEQKQLKSIETLCKEGANLNKKNNDHLTPAQYAFILQDETIFKYLSIYKKSREITRKGIYKIKTKTFYTILPPICLLISLFCFALLPIYYWAPINTGIFLFYKKKINQFPLNLAHSPAVASFSLSLYIIGFVCNLLTIFKTTIILRPLNSLLYLIFCLLFIYWNIKLMKMDPGFIAKSKFNIIDFLNEKIKLQEISEINNLEICTSCLIRKPLRSKHDNTFDRCIARFDHRCLFT
ncbi:ankyrin repeat and protein kinase domain-containing protein [Anaeramoeba flamelloides]|uniref:Palmitoyltransferase n=1 Tax=Anaeramoeba flamelloides TaxID=1746091 RepID=A0ABQ8YYZ2_9EUKA|nr:ankyrin repeat and protein kinase domain-containing protein [Anaeramoeba flamelloides]